MGKIIGIRAALAALSAMLCAAGATAAAAREEGESQPVNAVFIQRDVGEEISAVTLGLIRKTSLSYFDGQLNVYGELSLSRWGAREHHPSDSGALLQLGLTPVLRFTPSGQPFFVEFGIGLTVTSEIYRKNERQFSTPYNFGDHIAIGWLFGPRHENELAFRIEHFSNGNIKLPNPGENFRALRYVRWFD